LGAAVRDAVLAHGALRTALVGEGGEPYQLVLTRDACAPLLIEAESSLADPRTALPHDFARWAGEHLSPGEGRVQAVWLVRAPDGSRLLVTLASHLVFDGWSRNALLGDIGRAYEHRARGLGPWQATRPQF